MSNPCKFSLKNIYFAVFAFLLVLASNRLRANTVSDSILFGNSLTDFYAIEQQPLRLQDTIPVKKDSLPKTITRDTISLKMSKDTFSFPIKYYAQDSLIVLVKDKAFVLYGSTHTTYDDIVLDAPFVMIDQATNTLKAFNKKDSTGAITQEAKFQQGEQAFTSDTLAFNFKSGKGLSQNTITQSGEMFIHGEVVKKVDKSIMFIKRGFLTTCNLDEPHFGFLAGKIKAIPGKATITGPVHPEFEGVPIPVYLPFSYYPGKIGRSSGFIAPQFTTNDQMGIGLENFGYYKVFNDYWDSKFSGSVYSYGTWSADVSPSYRKRYRYNGSMRLSWLHTVRNFKKDPDYFASNNYSVFWNHSMDSKARPGVRFAANVNASSSSYNKNLPNQPLINFQNRAASTITYSKSWIDKPFNLSINANHSQENNTGLVSVSFPIVDFSVNTIYPFQKKEQVGSPKWYQKFGIGYSGAFTNQVSFYDSIKYGKSGNKTFFKQLKDTAIWSARHSVPITFSFPALFGGALIISPGVSYSQDWIQKATRYGWNDTKKKVDTSLIEGFFVDQRASFSLSANTSLYGMYQFRNSNVKAIRHVMRPNVGFSYTPDFNKNHIRSFQSDKDKKIRTYNEMTGGLQENSKREFAGLTFGLENTLEMKKRSAKDSTIKKVRLIDRFGFSGSYNLLADSLKLSPINFSFSTNLFEKVNLNASSTLDPYVRDSKGDITRFYAWQGPGAFSLGRLTNTSLSLSTSFQSKPRDKGKADKKQAAIEAEMNDPVLLEEKQRLLDYMQTNPSEFVDFNIPWQFSLSYSLNIINEPKPDYSSYVKKVSSNVNVSGSFSLTPKWNLTSSAFYNFDDLELQTFTLGISRDLHCWQLAINITPVGYYKFFNFTISPKSTLLQDLRINRTRSFFNGR